jgi:hypothetical protein
VAMPTSKAQLRCRHAKFRYAMSISAGFHRA